jgi:hypothetical protein
MRSEQSPESVRRLGGGGGGTRGSPNASRHVSHLRDSPLIQLKLFCGKVPDSVCNPYHMKTVTRVTLSSGQKTAEKWVPLSASRTLPARVFWMLPPSAQAMYAPGPAPWCIRATISYAHVTAVL